MANQEHVDILMQGKDTWNAWRKKYPQIQPDLSDAILNGLDLSDFNLSGSHLPRAYLVANLVGADFSGSCLIGACFNEAKLINTNLSGANCSRANFRRANLFKANLNNTYSFETSFNGANLNEACLNEANLSRADFSSAALTGANFFKANLSEAYLSYAWLTDANLSSAYFIRANFAYAHLNGANLRNADLSCANFTDADLSKANLEHANLKRAIFVGTNLTHTTLTNSRIHGISVWDVIIEDTKQLNLIITLPGQPTITVDNLKVAQFIYLLLNNQEIRDVIDTLTSKVVLILGRFTPERIAVLDALREALRKYNYTPVLFDFEKPANRDITETISTLAHMARFVIADLTDAKSLPQELQTIVPHLPSVPIQPLLHASDREYSMFEHFPRYPWVLPAYRYTDQVSLLQTLSQNVIDPAEKKAKELRQ